MEEKTLRDEIAIAAMQGLLSSNRMGMYSESLSEYSYEIADAMLKARIE